MSDADEESFVILGSSPNSYQSFSRPFESHKTASNLLADSLRSANGNESIKCSLTTSIIENSKINSLSECESNLMMNNSTTSIEPTPVSKKSSIDSAMNSSLLASNSIKNGSESVHKSTNKITSMQNLNVSTNTFIDGLAQEGTLAARFLMGDVPIDQLKSNVFSQFPSLRNSQVNTEDVIKLQTLMTENFELKETVKKNNVTARQHFTILQKWKDEMKEYKDEQVKMIGELQETVAKLHNENLDLRKELDMKLEQIKINEDIIRKENDDMIKSLSEKSAQIQNMASQIDKLEQQQLNSYEYIKKHSEDEDQKNASEHEYVSVEEHKRIIKDFEDKLSEISAQNMEFEDMKKIYFDEMDCLKVNLTASEELLKKAQADICVLQSKDSETTEHFKKFDEERKEMEQKIFLLENQLDVYSKDFAMERDARENLAGEKEKVLADLRLLQKRNQELLEGASRWHASKNNGSSSSKKIDIKSEETGPKAKPEEQIYEPSQFICPLCGKTYRILNDLHIHVQDCIDK